MGFALRVAKILIQKWLLRPEQASRSKHASTGPCHVCGRIVATYTLHDGVCERCRLDDHTNSSGHRQKGDDNSRPFGENRNDLGAAYQFLQCKETDSDSVIKKKFREMAKQCHPDRLRDLPDHKVSDANRLFHDLREAYELIMRSRNG
jgi:hypothetical protein